MPARPYDVLSSLTRFARYLCLALALSACADRATAPGESSSVLAPASGLASRGDATSRVGSVARWNALARRLVADHKIAPPIAARLYTYLSVAQDRAARAGRHDDSDNDSDHDEITGSYRAAINAASSSILTYILVTELKITASAPVIAAEWDAQRRGTHASERAGEAYGRAVAGALIERAKSDGAAAPWTGSVPSGSEFWSGKPQLPMWGKLRPWLMESGDQFRSPPPPAMGSLRFAADLAEVRSVSDRRTPAQLEIARFWADGPGTSTPPGHWNEITLGLAAERRWNDRKIAHALALVNMAMADAIVGCWDSKYTYWVIRPYQVDPGITTPIGKPPHPAYPSGHACSSSAAAGVLGDLFPKERSRVDAMAAESGLSRIYGGIHYRFDIEAGAALGRSVAALAVRHDDHRER